jgi:xylan 1,4-beta-xylosidase
VLTWAFTFPETPYFAGYRALTTNGIHLPVLNAFKLLGSLEGERLSVTSSGALGLDELLASSVRQEADVDALAAIAEDRIQILVWNYHDDLVDSEAALVRLDVTVPARFGAYAEVTHVRVDGAHGDAFAVWEAQGRPPEPAAAQLAALRQAMEPAVLERGRLLEITSGAARLSFELPRFGLSLLTITPSSARPREPSSTGDEACSCRFPGRARPELPALLSLALVVGLSRRRRRTRGA